MSFSQYIVLVVSFAFKQPQPDDDIVKLSNGNIAN